jgi:hypothetical protein
MNEANGPINEDVSNLQYGRRAIRPAHTKLLVERNQ